MPVTRHLKCGSRPGLVNTRADDTGQMEQHDDDHGDDDERDEESAMAAVGRRTLTLLRVIPLVHGPFLSQLMSRRVMTSHPTATARTA